MANAGPDTNGSQFFLVYADSALRPNYTIFGRIAPAGLRTLDTIAAAGVAPTPRIRPRWTARRRCAPRSARRNPLLTPPAAGVPVVTVPFGRDQPEVARRVEMAGVGVRLPASRLDPARLGAAVIKAMTLRENAAAVGKAIRAAGGPAVAADVTEHLTDVPVG